MQAERNNTVRYNGGSDRNEVEKHVGKKFVPVAIQESNTHTQSMSKGQLHLYRPQVQNNSTIERKPAPSRVANWKDAKPAESSHAGAKPQINNKEIEKQQSQQQLNNQATHHQPTHQQPDNQPTKHQPTHEQPDNQAANHQQPNNQATQHQPPQQHNNDQQTQKPVKSQSPKKQPPKDQPPK